MLRLKRQYWRIRESADGLRQKLARRAFAHAEAERIAADTVAAPAEHARAAAEWLARAQDHSGCDGISKCYYPVPGRWGRAYPETSGYILGSFLDYAHVSGESSYRDRAKRVADWLLTIQLPCGGIQAGTLRAQAGVPTIFNTGQVVHGWVDAWQTWRDTAYANAAMLACRWLIQQQDEDGCWRRGGSPSVERQSENVYNVRVAWAMIRAGRALDEPTLVRAGHQNLSWAATRETAPGWMNDNDFSDCPRPIMHTIAYAAEGFFEAGCLLGEERFVSLARRTCQGVAGAQRADGHLPGRLNARLQPVAPWVCLTGDAQMLALWRRMTRRGGDARLAEAATRLSLALRHKQALRHPSPGVQGGLPGAVPIGGGYLPYAYPNWATKFLLDAMMAEMPRQAVSAPAGQPEGIPA